MKFWMVWVVWRAGWMGCLFEALGGWACEGWLSCLLEVPVVVGVVWHAGLSGVTACRSACCQ